MSRARLNIFVEPEHAKRLEDMAVHRGVSKSSVIAAALASFLSPDAMDQRDPDRCVHKVDLREKDEDRQRQHDRRRDAEGQHQEQDVAVAGEAIS